MAKTIDGPPPQQPAAQPLLALRKLDGVTRCFTQSFLSPHLQSVSSLGLADKGSAQLGLSTLGQLRSLCLGNGAAHSGMDLPHQGTVETSPYRPTQRSQSLTETPIPGGSSLYQVDKTNRYTLWGPEFDFYRPMLKTNLGVVALGLFLSSQV